nr:MAG TPA: hypothetical protein [Caudoviricetes sp.]
MAIAGRVAIVPKGDWSADVTYKRLDAVTVNNTLYIAKKSVPAGTATTDTEYWAKSISGGATNVATSTEDGLMAKGDKKKLDGIDGDVAAKLGESKDGSLTYNGTEIKSSVETGKGLSIGEDGKLQVNIDGTTLTMDQVNNVIKLADTLKDAINGAFPAANVANNQITTVEGFALDARQANPNLDGTLAKQISDLNGSLETYEMKILSIVDSNFATENRCGCVLIQKRWILLTGEINADFTNVKPYTSYTALKSSVVPFLNTTFTVVDEDGMCYTGIFYADGRIDFAIRSYIPESKKQILRFSCIAFAPI